jgi:C4-type Zn-finger protein
MTRRIWSDYTWKCPRCKKRHYGTWFFWAIPSFGDVIAMKCNHCGKKSKMKCKLVKA